MYEKFASRRTSSTSLISSSARSDRSNLLPPGTLYMMKRKVTLPLRPCAALRSMSRTWYTVPLCSTTLPFLISAARVIARSSGLLRLQAHGAVEADGLAIEVTVADDEGDRGSELV